MCEPTRRGPPSLCTTKTHREYATYQVQPPGTLRPVSLDILRASACSCLSKDALKRRRPVDQYVRVVEIVENEKEVGNNKPGFDRLDEIDQQSDCAGEPVNSSGVPPHEELHQT